MSGRVQKEGDHRELSDVRGVTPRGLPGQGGGNCPSTWAAPLFQEGLSSVDGLAAVRNSGSRPVGLGSERLFHRSEGHRSGVLPCEKRPDSRGVTLP
jgi:hypothetical protein